MSELTAINKDQEKEKKKIHIPINQITLKDVSFRFPGRKLLLNKINLTLEKGRTTAIIGKSGVGKSTLLEVITGSYEISSGKFLINNMFISNYDLDCYKQQISFVGQETTIFSGSILFNIVLDENINSSQISNFIDFYNLDKIVAQFPNGLNTIIGEEGIKISGGQKQFISFLRALYKKPEILILDEFSSSMDNEMETFCFSMIEKIKSTTIILLTTHRLYSMKEIADEILVLDNKKINNSHQL